VNFAEFEPWQWSMSDPREGNAHDPPAWKHALTRRSAAAADCDATKLKDDGDSLAIPNVMRMHEPGMRETLENQPLRFHEPGGHSLRPGLRHRPGSDRQSWSHYGHRNGTCHDCHQASHRISLSCWKNETSSSLLCFEFGLRKRSRRIELRIGSKRGDLSLKGWGACIGEGERDLASSSNSELAPKRIAVGARGAFGNAELERDLGIGQTRAQ
jgi:hypothetical protein